METKKNTSLDLEKKRTFHFTIGLVLTVAMITVAFEWRSPVTPVLDLGKVGVEKTAPPIPPTVLEPPKPPQPKKIPVIIESVDDDVEVADVIIELPKFEDPTSDYIPIEPDDEVTETPFLIVEEKPSFPGGEQAFYTFVSKNMKYPRSAIQRGAEGKVFLQFVVEKDGSLTNIKVIKGIDAACDAEAVRVLRESPQWNPGKQRGQAVRVQMVLPVNFQLQ